MKLIMVFRGCCTFECTTTDPADVIKRRYPDARFTRIPAALGRDECFELSFKPDSRSLVEE